MLCHTCRFMVFKRPKAIGLDHVLAPDGYPNNEFLYFIHSKYNAQFQESAKRCHFCRKMKVGFEDEDGPIPSGKDIILCVFVPNPLIRSLEQHVRDDLLHASCGQLQTLTTFDNREMAIQSDSAITNSPAAPGSESQLEEMRREDHDTLSRLNLALAMFWLEMCNHTHQLCRSITSSPKVLPYRIIDLTTPGRPYLTLGQGRKEPYVTLSYKWGSARKHTTTQDTINDFQQNLWSDLLPRTFKDAISTATRLKFQFLWIDALCIKQDSPAEVASQIAVMGEIYSGSSLTLFAAAGDNTDVGLGFKRDSIVQKPTSLNMRFDTDDEVFEGVFYAQRFRNPHSPPATHPLFNRGWVLQEEILSFRGLFFHREEISWHCMHAGASEYRPGMSLTSSPVDVKNLDNFPRLCLCTRFKSALADLPQYPQTNHRVTVFDEWYKMVETYSRRELTYNIDIINAITGISSVLARVHNCTFVAGLCVEDMQLGLLWRARDALPWLTPVDQVALVARTAWDKLATKIFGNTARTTVPSSGRTKRYSIMVESFDGEVVPVGTPKIITAVEILPPSWSWTSVFHNKAGIEFEHTRRYGRSEQDGIQVLNYHFVDLSTGTTTIALTIQAPTRWATVSPRDPFQDYLALYDSSQEEHSPFYLSGPQSYKAGDTVARLYPDEDGVVVVGMAVLCVMCAKATQQWKQDSNTSTMFTGIAVVPAPGSAHMFVRVGLVIAVYDAWFKRPFRWERLEMMIL